MENIGFFACFPPSGSLAGGTPALRQLSMSAKRFSCFSMLASLPVFNHLRAAKRYPIVSMQLAAHLSLVTRHFSLARRARPFLSAKRFPPRSCSFPPSLLPHPFQCPQSGFHNFQCRHSLCPELFPPFVQFVVKTSLPHPSPTPLSKSCRGRPVGHSSPYPIRTRACRAFHPPLHRQSPRLALWYAAFGR